MSKDMSTLREHLTAIIDTIRRNDRIEMKDTEAVDAILKAIQAEVDRRIKEYIDEKYNEMLDI